MARRAAVLTISDRCSSGEREDRSGPEAARLLERLGFEIVGRDVVPDEREAIAGKLRDWMEEERPHLIVTTGGTGVAPRDVTPEATLPLIEKRLPGVEEEIRRAGLSKGIPTAALSRGVSGVSGTTWIINLPGSVGAVRDGLEAVGAILDHALEQMEGGGDHD